LRFTNKVTGSIEIDEIDIDDINLEDLRDRVSIIPQDAVLFSGSIRSNLDLFQKFDDTELNMALLQNGLWDEERHAPVPGDWVNLDTSQMTNVVGRSGATTPMKYITLDSPVTSNGDNFSQGILLKDEFSSRVTPDPCISEDISPSLQGDHLRRGDCVR
jgi:ABC-type multidrug transport system fused ATPase/permease subunit